MLADDDDEDVLEVNDGDPTIQSLHVAIQKLSVKTQPETESSINIFVQRRYALKNAMEDLQCSKINKLVTSKVFVEFAGEPAVDTGGPSRELFSIAFQHVFDSRITRGSLPYITFMHDQNALGNGDYKTFGQLVALSFLNGCGGPHIFSPSLARFISGIKENLPPEDVSLMHAQPLKIGQGHSLLLTSASVWELTRQLSHFKKKMR